ncbi:MAG: invasion associated locus B family protein [Pseudomonadota bacterium]
MTGSLRATAALIAILLASGVPAQDAPSAVDTVNPDDLSLGTPEGQEAGVGETYIAEVHGDWEVRCIRAEEGQPEPCQLYQLLRDAGDSPVAEVNIFDVDDNGEVVAGATIVTPLDTLLTPQMRLQVDDGQALRYPFSFCQQIGCFVRIGLSEADLAAYRAGSEVTVTIVPLQAPNQTVDLTLSLVGFTAGFQDLNERVIAAREAIRAQEESASE